MWGYKKAVAELGCGSEEILSAADVAAAMQFNTGSVRRQAFWPSREFNFALGDLAISATFARVQL